jgi:hypothetical protein
MRRRLDHLKPKSEELVVREILELREIPRWGLAETEIACKIQEQKLVQMIGQSPLASRRILDVLFEMGFFVAPKPLAGMSRGEHFIELTSFFWSYTGLALKSVDTQWPPFDSSNLFERARPKFN